MCNVLMLMNWKWDGRYMLCVHIYHNKHINVNVKYHVLNELIITLALQPAHSNSIRITYNK